MSDGELFNKAEQDAIMESAERMNAMLDSVDKPSANLPAVREYDDELLRVSADPNVDIDKLRAVLDMKIQMEDREAKRTFYEHFAAMQAELEAVPRDSIIKNRDGTVRSKYGKLGAMLKVARPILSKHGFSYHFGHETLDNGQRRIWAYLNGHGHEESASFDMPLEKGDASANDLQKVGTTDTYGKRYAFQAVTGWYLEDDDDGNSWTMDDGVKYAEYIHAIQAENDIDALRKLGKECHQKLKAEHDDHGASLVLSVYNKRKAELTGE